MSNLRLPDLPEGLGWFAALAQIAPAAADCAFFEPDEDGKLPDGGFVWVCVPAHDREEARDFIGEHAEENGAEVIGFMEVRAMPSVLALPRDQEGQLDPAIAEAFADAALGAEMVHGILYVYDAEPEA